MSPRKAGSTPQTDNSIVVGIDLGTTNTAIGWVRQGKPEVIEVAHERLMPSVVGWTPSGTLVTGHAALNQYALYPERTIRSVKRSMGTDRTFEVDGRVWSPVEISAVILRTLRQAAEQALGMPVNRAVITVPAFFDDAQRVATRQAGELAGFVVERILNEPTAAALCYAAPAAKVAHYLVYDLGGGTFDVSVVRVQGEVTEVLASDGDVHLGGDDMDDLLLTELQSAFEAAHGTPLDPEDRRAHARLKRAAEQAKIALSSEHTVEVNEENLTTVNGVAAHLTTRIGRTRYEELIHPLLKRTLGSVERALSAAELTPDQIDELILVGGASRTPLVGELLRQSYGLVGRADVNPDEAVVLGAAIAAARAGGQQVNRILVDISPHSIGISALLDFSIQSGPLMVFEPIIPRNTPIPARRSRVFLTTFPGQQVVEIEVYQGESTNLEENSLLGSFTLEGLDETCTEQSEIATEMVLSLDGTLEVAAVEVHTGRRVKVAMQAPVRRLSEVEVIAGQQKIEELMEWGTSPSDEQLDLGPMRAHDPALAGSVEKVFARWSLLLTTVSDIDAKELVGRRASLEASIQAQSWDAVRREFTELEDVLFYLES